MQFLEFFAHDVDVLDREVLIEIESVLHWQQVGWTERVPENLDFWLRHVF